MTINCSSLIYFFVVLVFVTGVNALPTEANSAGSGTIEHSRGANSAGAKLALAAKSPSVFTTAAYLRMEQLLQFYKVNRQFMGSVIVARDQQVILDKGYGFANLEWNVPNAPDTKFRLASITKQFTAASILLLEERGKLKVEDPIKKYIADAPASWDKITIFDLLTHSSGIPTYDKFPDYDSFKRLDSSSDDLLKRISNKPLEFQPGEKYSYSNSGYLVLGILIERISGQSFGRFVQNNIFTPLDMRDSGYGSVSAIIKRRASGYVPAAGGLVNASFNDWSNSFSAGALYSSTEDMLRWEQGLFAGKLLSKASLSKMTTPFKQGYAFGLEVRDEKGERIFEHPGSVDGFNNMMAFYPKDKLQVVVLSNKSGLEAAEIASQLAAIAHGAKSVLPFERKSIPTAQAILKQYAGVYHVKSEQTIAVTVENGQLVAQLTGQAKYPLFAETESKFFPKVADAEFEFCKNSRGEVTHLLLRQDEEDTRGDIVKSESSYVRQSL